MQLLGSNPARTEDSTPSTGRSPRTSEHRTQQLHNTLSFQEPWDFLLTENIYPQPQNKLHQIGKNWNHTNVLSAHKTIMLGISNTETAVNLPNTLLIILREERILASPNSQSSKKRQPRKAITPLDRTESTTWQAATGSSACPHAPETPLSH